ncbi:MAG: hypothetical protein WBB74_01375 [Gaiellaceae bacterium]
MIVPILALFSSTVIAGAKTFGKPDYAKAARQLPAGPLVLVSEQHQTFLDRLSSADSSRELCSVTSSELKLIATRYEVGHMAVTVGGKRIEIATVSGSGANDHELRSLLGDPKLKCKLVREAGIFYLPFDAHGS